jgi:hypothetical protein
MLARCPWSQQIEAREPSQSEGGYEKILGAETEHL